MLIKKAITTLKDEGFFLLVKKIANYLNNKYFYPKDHLDEVDIVFDILKAD